MPTLRRFFCSGVCDMLEVREAASLFKTRRLIRMDPLIRSSRTLDIVHRESTVLYNDITHDI